MKEGNMAKYFASIPFCSGLKSFLVILLHTKYLIKLSFFKANKFITIIIIKNFQCYPDKIIKFEQMFLHTDLVNFIFILLDDILFSLL